MIKRLDSDRSTTARRGFQHVSEVIERLIRIYELQAERQNHVEPGLPVLADSAMAPQEFVTSGVQSTFGWE